MIGQMTILKNVPALVFSMLVSVSGDEFTFMIQDMAQEIFCKIADLAVNAPTAVNQGMAAGIRQAKDSERASSMSLNQLEAFQCLQRLFESYYVDMVLPEEADALAWNESVAALGSSTSLQPTWASLTNSVGIDSQISRIHGTLRRHVGTGALGSIRDVIRPVIQKVSAHILKRHYFSLVELIIDNEVY